MKRNVALIILTCLFFSRLFLSHTSASSEGYLGEMLDVFSGPEAFELESKAPTPQQFYSPAIQTTYNNFITIDSALREEFLSEYRSGAIDYYTMSDIIRAYNTFTYYTQKTLNYADMRAQGLTGSTTDAAIENGYQQMRTSYVRVKSLLQ